MFFEKGETMSEGEKKFLEIVDLKKGFGSGETRQEVLRGMNFSVAKGEFCVLLGPSGSGKSTLLNIIGGIDSADCGYISINGDKLEDMSEKKLTQYRRKHLGYVFQMYNLIANLNVKENIEVGAYLSDNALDIDELFYPQLGVKLCSMAGGGVQKIYMVLLREPSRRDRSGSDLFHLRDGFEIKMNFDRNVSCFIFVNALMHNDFFD